MRLPAGIRRVGSFVAVAAVAAAVGVGLAAWRESGPSDLSARIVSSLNDPGTQEMPAAAPSPTAGSLESLLPGLEAKVAAHPQDLDARLLLAQTYHALDRRSDALRVLDALAARHPDNGRVRFVRAEVLMHSDARADLDAAFAAFGASVRTDPETAPLARLRQGEIRLRLRDRNGALRVWRDYARTLAADDPHRAMFDDAIARAATAPGS